MADSTDNKPEKEGLTEKQQKKFIRRGRGRPWKNLLWWLFGFFTSFIVLGTASALALWVFPLSVVTGNDGKIVSTSISNGTIWDFIMNYGKYTMGDIPVVSEILKKAMEENNLEQYFVIDYDALNSIRFDGSSFSDQFDYSKYIKITATINSLGIGKDLGFLNDLSAFTTYETVTEPIDTNAENFQPKLYYYKDGETYKRVFDDEGHLNEGAHEPYYFAALFDVPILDMMNLAETRIQSSSALSLLSVFGVEEGSILYSLAEGKTVADLANMDAEAIYLKDVLNPISDYQQLYDILSSAVGQEPEEITLSALSELDSGNIKLSSVLTEETLGEAYGDAYKIILSALGLEDTEENRAAVTLGDMSGFNIKRVRLNDVLPYDSESNQKLYDILLAATRPDGDDGSYDYTSITIETLSNMSTDKIPLTTVLDQTEDTEIIFKILKSATGATEDDYSDLTVGKLSEGFDVNKVTLSDVLEYRPANPLDPEDKGVNVELYDILLSAVDRDGATAENLTVGDINNGLDVNNIKLTAVIKQENAEDLYNVLLSALSDVYIDETHPEYGKISQATDIRLKHLENIETNNIKLVDVLPIRDDMAVPPVDNEQLYRVICGALGKTIDAEHTLEDRANEILVGDLSDFKTDNINLTDVLSYRAKGTEGPEDEGENVTLYKILCDCTGKSAENIKVVDLNDLDIDSLSLSAVMPYEEDDPTTLGVKEGNEDLYAILCDICSTPGNHLDPHNEEDRNSITVGDLKNFDTSKIHLSSVLDPDDPANDKLYDIFVDIKGVDKEDLTINDLKDFSMGSLHLTNVLDYRAPGTLNPADEGVNANLYDILNMACGNPGIENLTVDDLNAFEAGNIALTTVLPHDANNESLYKILIDVTSTPGNPRTYPDDIDSIKIADLSEFDTSKIHLASVLETGGDNTTIYNILSDATGKTPENILVGDLSGASFNTNNIRLSVFINPTDNPKLYDILRDACGAADNDHVTVGAISGFDIASVRLGTCLDDDGGNKILANLINDDSVTIGNLGSKINDLSLSDIYGDTVFTTDNTLSATGDTYDLVGDEYVYNDLGTGEYYISKDASIWLLFCFSYEDADIAANGRVDRFTPATLKFSDLTDNTSDLGDLITGSTIYNLMACGIFDYDPGASPAFTHMTLNQAIDYVSGLL